MQCTALYDFSALEETQLSFSKGIIILHILKWILKVILGDIIKIRKKGGENDWWEGTLERTQEKGLFPSNYVKVVDLSKIIQALKPEQQNNLKEIAQYKLTESVESKQHKRGEPIRYAE